MVSCAQWAGTLSYWNVQTSVEILSCFPVLNYLKNTIYVDDKKFICVYLFQKLSKYCTILQSYCEKRKGTVVMAHSV